MRKKPVKIVFKLINLTFLVSIKVMNHRLKHLMGKQKKEKYQLPCCMTSESQIRL